MAGTTAPRSWSDIPPEFADLVLRRLPAHVDRVRFAAVCPQWRDAAREIRPPPPLPLLLLPDGTVYSLPGSEPFHIPACEGYTDVCSKWLVFKREDGCYLRDPFSNTTVTLPALSRVLIRYVGEELGPAWMERQHAKNLTVRQVKFCSPQLIAASIVFQGSLRIAVCQPGAFSWWSMHMDDRSCIFEDIIVHQGKLYAVDRYEGGLFSVDISIDHNTGDPWVSGVHRVINGSTGPSNVIVPDYASFPVLYLVELCGGLLMVQRTMYHRWKRPRSFEKVPPPWKNEFEIFEADFEQSQWSKVTTIGDDQVLFLRQHCSRSACISQYKMSGDRIFFLEHVDTDDLENGGGDDNRYEERLGP